MTEVLFYHLQSQPLERALPSLLEKCLERQWRAVVQVGSEERRDALEITLTGGQQLERSYRALCLGQKFRLAHLAAGNPQSIGKTQPQLGVVFLTELFINEVLEEKLADLLVAAT